MRNGVTLIEIIFTIAIAGILAVGTSEILKNVAIQTQRAKEMTTLSLDTQSALDQIAGLLYYRVPSSAIGYNVGGSYQPVLQMNAPETILEWLGTFHEARLLGKLNNFVDINASSFNTKTIISPDSDFTFINTNLTNKFPGKSIADMGIIFAGSFDKGGGGKPEFGWHGDKSSEVYKVSSPAIGSFRLEDSMQGTQPKFIYEKYYLADSAYAVARSVDVDLTNCSNAPKITDTDNTLLLFSNYRPWNGETFCGDKNKNGVGDVTILAEDITGFRAEPINLSIRISIDAKRKVKGTKTFVHVGKQKVVF